MKSLYDNLKHQEGEGSKAREASKRWFDNFRKRWLKNDKMTGEAASANQEAAVVFPDSIKKIIVEKGYLPQDVFNADKVPYSGQKKVPLRTFISKEEKRAPGFKAELFCANAVRFLIRTTPYLHTAANPRALKEKTNTSCLSFQGGLDNENTFSGLVPSMLYP